MILIADSGSTKTDWAIVIGSTQPVVIKTQGINPVHQSREEIVKVLREEFVGVMGSTPEVQKLRSAAILTRHFRRPVSSKHIVICSVLHVHFVVVTKALPVF